MNPELANVVTQRLQTQLGALLIQLIQVQAEKEALEAEIAKTDTDKKEVSE